MSRPIDPGPSSAVLIGRLAVLMVAGFVETLGAFLVVALLPFYGEEYGASPVMVSILVSAFAVAQMLTAPFWGRLSDHYGRKRVILIGLLVSAIAYVVFGLANSLALLLISRVAQGVGGGTVSVVFAYVADALPGERRAEGLGWLTSATSLAAMVGPAIGSFAFGFDTRAPGLVPAALSLFALLFVWWFLPELGQKNGEKTGTWFSLSDVFVELGQVVTAVVSVLRHPRRPVHGLIGLYCAGMLAWTGLTVVLTLYLDRRFSVTAETIWIPFTFIGGVSLVMRLVFLGPLVRRFGEIRLIRAGCLVMALGLALLPLAKTYAMLAVAIGLVPVATALLFPSTTALISRWIPDPSETGLVLGVQQAWGGLSKSLGPLLAGALFQVFGPESPFFWGSGLLIVAFLCAVKIRKATY